MISGAQSSSGATGADNGASPAAKSTDKVNKEMFLQLLVAQIKNQDPLNPSDGVQFLTQLAQFQQMEQGINMGQDIAAIRTSMDRLAGPAVAADSREQR